MSFLTLIGYAILLHVYIGSNAARRRRQQRGRGRGDTENNLPTSYPPSFRRSFTSEGSNLAPSTELIAQRSFASAALRRTLALQNHKYLACSTYHHQYRSDGKTRCFSGLSQAKPRRQPAEVPVPAMGVATQRLSLSPSSILEHVERLHVLLCGGTVAACGGGVATEVSRGPQSQREREPVPEAFRTRPRQQRREARRLLSSCFCLLQLGLRSLVPLLRLVLFTLMLLPVFIRLTYQYFTLSRLQRGLRYGPHSRNLLDLYLPQDKRKNSIQSAKKRPIVIFFSGNVSAILSIDSFLMLSAGGAWVIGNKAWGFAIGKTLSRNDIIVVAPDYRNFPDGNLSDMLSDCHVGWRTNCQVLVFANAVVNRPRLHGRLPMQTLLAVTWTTSPCWASRPAPI